MKNKSSPMKNIIATFIIEDVSTKNSGFLTINKEVDSFPIKLSELFSYAQEQLKDQPFRVRNLTSISDVTNILDYDVKNTAQ